MLEIYESVTQELELICRDIELLKAGDRSTVSPDETVEKLRDYSDDLLRIRKIAEKYVDVD